MKRSIKLLFLLFFIILGRYSWAQHDEVRGMLINDVAQDVVHQKSIISKRVFASALMSNQDHRRLANFVHQWREELGADSLVELIYVVQSRDRWRRELYKTIKGWSLDSILMSNMSAKVFTVGQIGDRELIDSMSFKTLVQNQYKKSLIIVEDISVGSDGEASSMSLCDVSMFEAYSSKQIEQIIEVQKDYTKFVDQDFAELNNDSMVYNSYDLGNYAWNGESMLARLFDLFMQDVAQCGVTAYSPNSWSDSLDIRNISVRDVERILPFDNDLVVVTLSGSALMEYINKCARTRFRQMRNDQSDLLRARVPSFCHVDVRGDFDGAEYDLIRGSVKMKRVGGVCSDSMYRIAMNSYQANKLQSEFKVNQVNVIGDLRVLFAQWLIKFTSAYPTSAMRICESEDRRSMTLVPHRWARVAMERERRMMIDVYSK